MTPHLNSLVRPFHESEIQAAVLCSKKLGLQVRVRSGGHDYEGPSYLCKTPFIIIDLINLRYIEVNLADETAWAQSGATLGELYYSIAKKSWVHGFSGGLCPTVGIGGHLSGGGFGILIRKHGLAADNVVDARFIAIQKSPLEDEFQSQIRLCEEPNTRTGTPRDLGEVSAGTKCVHDFGSIWWKNE
ncbi:berberine bridge enzyme-like 22 [Malus domestica]|uniref:berberine bridge enzyme-like 22 n=1 Tax=Malus domestica TaxID=3750 RepID=UPI0010AA5826|nr:berberine bridge enzyme-like 22 [Malus domestica]